MFGSAPQGASAYSKIGMETGVIAASPHQLITMLFDGAITASKDGLVQMEQRNIEKKGIAISKAILIIESGLRASLNKDAGEIAHNLDSLYDYMCRRLLEANLHNDASRLKEVIGLLSDIKESWDSINPTRASAEAAAALSMQPTPPSKILAFDNLAPRRASLVSAG